jgi:hypothetical protein
MTRKWGSRSTQGNSILINPKSDEKNMVWFRFVSFLCEHGAHQRKRYYSLTCGAHAANEAHKFINMRFSTCDCRIPLTLRLHALTHFLHTDLGLVQEIFNESELLVQVENSIYPQQNAGAHPTLSHVLQAYKTVMKRHNV